MKRHTSLPRNKPLLRSGFKRRSGLLSPISKKERARRAEWREAKNERAKICQYKCEGAIPGVCDGYGTHGHHVIRNRMLNTVSNCRWLCNSCHRWVHANPGKAYGLGLLASKYQPIGGTP